MNTALPGSTMIAKPHVQLAAGLTGLVFGLLAVVAAPQESSEDWRQFRHSSGAVLSHPPDWQVSEQPGGLALQPPNPAPNELIAASGAAANGATDPASPDVANYLDAIILQMFPGLARSEPPQPVSLAEGASALYRYAGRSFDGSEVVSHVYVTIQGPTAYTLSAIAPSAVMDDRTATLEKIFASIGPGTSKASAAPVAAKRGQTATGDDPRLVGMFGGEARAGGSDVGIYVNTQLVYVLNADGTLYYGAQSHFSSSGRDYNGSLKWTATGNTGGNVRQGRWNAANGFLNIQWQSGERSYFAYGFEPDGSLVLRSPQTRKLINFYSRIH